MLEDIPYDEADGIIQTLLDTAFEASKRINSEGYAVVPECEKQPAIAAVDGGSAIIYDMGSLVVGAIRTGYLVYGPGKTAHESISPLQLVAVDRFNSTDLYEKACADMDVPLHEHPVELDAFIQRLRYLKEMRGALDALVHLKEGDILLLDGALRSDIPRPADVLAAVINQAEARGITVVGVSKSSSLNIQGIPMLALVKHQAEKLGLNTWLYPVDIGDRHEYGKVSIAKLHPS
ncbi:MAG: DNA double-strand break repair nuclease NurA, partial [Candidatus Thermoplasmatota archaeon]|nr:DNA double-strand break repair nuclease NurA [Candidatus Thermoplasmatota archaeon]